VIISVGKNEPTNMLESLKLNYEKSIILRVSIFALTKYSLSRINRNKDKLAWKLCFDQLVSIILYQVNLVLFGNTFSSGRKEIKT
jgi:hypothetical protein